MMLRLSTIALVLAAGSILPAQAQQLKATPIGDKTSDAAPPDHATVQKWMGQAVEQMLGGETASRREER